MSTEQVPVNSPRLIALQQALAAQRVDMLALAVTDNLRYALGGYAPHADERFCVLLLGSDTVALVVPALNADQARAHVRIPMYVYDDAAGPADALQDALQAAGLAGSTRIAVDEEMRADHLLLLQAALPAATCALAGAVVTPLRGRKDRTEIALLKRAAVTADAGVEAVYAAIKPGVTEIDLAAAAADGMRRAGADETAFLLLAAGPHSALPHHATGPYVLKAGDVVTIDIGSRVQGYCSDITRMAIVGGADPDPEYQRIHAIVEEAAQAARATARPGVLAREVDAAARAVITAAGYGAFFIHRTGHGLGLSVHEPPYITSTSETVLEEGMVFSIEPGIYLPGRFGVRLEEIVYLDADGAHILSALPRTVRIC
jgi:Xaa-Pro aminopeptidase